MLSGFQTSLHWKVHTEIRIRGVFKVNSCIWSKSCRCCVKWKQQHSIPKKNSYSVYSYNAIEMLKWNAFLKVNKGDRFLEFNK